LVVIHSCEGSYASCWGWLTNPTAQASAHYVINAAGTEVAQLVKESERAWHVSATYSCANNGEQRCDLDGQRTNDFAVGIEHAGFASQSGWAEPQIEASAKLVCNVTSAWNIAKDRYHIVAHQQLQPWNRNDPGPNWPWNTYLNRINALCGAGASPQNLIIDSNNANNDLNWGYVQISANWKSSDNVAGYYGSGYWYADTAPVSDSAAFFFKAEADGERTIDAWWTSGLDRSESATFVAFNAANQRVGSAAVDQTHNGGQWNELGRVRFTRGWNKITLSRWQPTGRVVVADAIRIR